jgi:membrane protein involved in colicin uptake
MWKSQETDSISSEDTATIWTSQVDGVSIERMMSSDDPNDLQSLLTFLINIQKTHLEKKQQLEKQLVNNSATLCMIQNLYKKLLKKMIKQQKAEKRQKEIDQKAEKRQKEIELKQNMVRLEQRQRAEREELMRKANEEMKKLKHTAV